MTDTVPAPRKQIEQALALVNEMTRFVGVMSLQDYVALDAVPRNLAAILAAPKAEPVGDGAHDQGRFARLGLTSENILDKMSEAATEIAGWGAGNEAAVIRFAIAEITRLSAQPESPKVEQEPVAKVVSAHGDPEAFGEREIEALRDLSGIPYDTPLYTNPAAASDVLLEVLKMVDLSLQAMADEGIIANGSWAFVTDAIAKHKGPQS